MKIGKAVELSGVPIEVIRISGLESVLARIRNSMMYDDKMPKSWRRNVLIPLYKGKGDAKECSNYRSLKMLKQAMKILERVFERRIRGAITISDIQMGFMPGKNLVDAIFAVKQLVEKYGTVGKDLFVAFMDVEKAFNLVPIEVIWWALRKKE